MKPRIPKANSIEELSKLIEERLDSLSNLTAKCWVCNENTNYWNVIVPDTNKDIGFGTPTTPNTGRFIFFPICEIHDTNLTEVMDAVRKSLKVHSIAMKN